MSETVPRPADAKQEPRWRPIPALDRRVLGVLIEKAKTTPEAYPLSVNAIRVGCNQKNNRYPLMEVEIEDVEEALSRLRELGAVGEVLGGGRVSRFRHYSYEWMGVDKAELSVMAELLLRGAQTEGELRGRVARMEPLPDLNALRPLLTSLKTKGLVLALTPEGRGAAVTHLLYEERELDKVKAQFAAEASAQGSGHSSSSASSLAAVAGSPSSAAHSHAPLAPQMASPAASLSSQPPAAAANQHEIDDLKRQLTEVRAEVAALRKDLDDLWSNFR